MMLLRFRKCQEVLCFIVLLLLCCVTVKAATITHASINTSGALSKARASSKGAPDYGLLLPVHSYLTSGETVTKALPDGITIPQAFFIVGPDARSYAWLAQHRDAILQQQAIGVGVNISTLAELNKLQAHSKAPIYPVSIDLIAKRLGLLHYPVLISKERVIS